MKEGCAESDLAARVLSRLTSLVTGPFLFKALGPTALGLQTKNGPVTRALTYT